jgi:hypothetical protein
MENDTAIQIPAGEIRTGDSFINDDGSGWIAVGDAKNETRPTRGPVAAVPVQYVPDGGRSVRFFDAGKSVPIIRHNG